MQSTDVSIMPQGGIPAQTGMTENIVSTASELQIRKPTMHIADRQAVGRNTNPSKSSLLAHTDLQGIVSSSLIPEWNSLNITGAASEQEIGPLWQTAAGGYDLAHLPLESTTKQAQAQRGSVSNAAGAHQENAGTSESDFEVNFRVLAMLSIRTETLHSSRNSRCSAWLLSFVSESRFSPVYVYCQEQKQV